MDEDGDGVRPSIGEGCGVPGYESWADEGVGEGEVDGAVPDGAREREPSIDTRDVEERVGQVGGPVEIGCGGFLLGAGDDS